MKTFATRLILAIACTVLSTTAFVRPRPLLAPFPEFTLKTWKFDAPEFITAADLGAHIATNLWLAESWSGYALDMRVQDALLLTPAVQGYYTNFIEGSGSIRLWFAPDWALWAERIPVIGPLCLNWAKRTPCSIHSASLLPLILTERICWLL
jgi:hypothetical protein